ncbi:MAG: late control protein D [Gammaproteobacteria bacterium]|nr:MAG: late control protein D [Gammaproteobacteria bacterium]
MIELPDFQITASSRTPTWQLFIDDKDVTAELSTRIINLSLVDNRGFEADTLSLTLDDTDGAIPLPERGAKLRLALGWRGTPMINKGCYIVDTIEHSGAPDNLSLSAKSADFRESLLERKSVSYPSQTIAELIKTIAEKHHLQYRVSDGLANIKLTHKIQSNESDANLLTRLAEEHDAIGTIKNDTLLFIRAGEAKSASGQPLPAVTITRTSGDQHRYSLSEREKVTGVKAYYRDVGKKKKVWVLAGNKEKTTSLKKAFPNKDSAQTAADAELKRLQRGVATFSIRLAFAMPHLFPETPIRAQGFKPKIDHTDWIITKATHELGDSGFITGIECERRQKKVL